MKIYFINEIIHRVDGSSVLNCASLTNRRMLKLRQTGDNQLPPIFKGTAYSITWKYHLRHRIIVTIAPITTPQTFWPNLILNNFYAHDLNIPQKIRYKLLRLPTLIVKRMIEDLSQQNFDLYKHYLPEPYLSELQFHCKRFTAFKTAITLMMHKGISQQASEAIYNIYGSDYSEILSNSTKLCAIQTFNSKALSKELCAFKWLIHQASCGSTIINSSDIPAQHREAIEWCRKNRLIIGGMDKFQLVYHAVQQRSIRLEMQRISTAFFPKYANSEIAYAHSRYSGLVGFFRNQQYLEQVSTSINSRISYICSDSLAITKEFITELSATLQLLGSPEPYLVIRNQNGAQIYSDADAILTTLNNFPKLNPDYRTFIIPELHHFTGGEHLLLLKQITERDRIIAISNLNIATDFEVGTQIAKQLSAYFPTTHISNSDHVSISDNISTLSFDISKIISKLKDVRMLVAICDHPEIISIINRSLHNESFETVLISNGSVFKRHDKVIIQPNTARIESAFLCRLLSTNDRGVYAESLEGHIRIPAVLLRNSWASLGFAMTPELACSIGIADAVLVCKDVKKRSLLNALQDYKISIKTCFTYHDNEAPTNLPFSIQRVTPTVE